MSGSFDWRGLVRRALAIASGAAVGLVVMEWPFELPAVQAVILTFSAGAFAQVAGVWWDERAQAKRSRGIPAGLIKMVGAEGSIASPCSPLGKVRVGLELWDARSADGAPIGPGQRVVVREVADKTLIVEPVVTRSHLKARSPAMSTTPSVAKPPG
jgi:membrane-bound ClpP family serine protease